ncbi:MAG: SDR family oxidoreductase [Acidobacteriaceae bacterium]|nr:SDR family oxidoreductase [Acidobacteriaceae bacterium]
MIAVVTGGGRGIGRAIAVDLSRLCRGIAVVARNANELVESVDAIAGQGGKAIAVVADVSDGVAVKRMIGEVESKLGPIDLLINNAAIGGPFQPLSASDPDEWWRCLEVNLKGPMLCTHAVLPGMVSRRRGRIVNVASGAGTIALPNMSAYVVSKTALIRLTETTDVEYGSHGVKCFAVSPGTVRTAMTEQVLNDSAAAAKLPFISQAFAEGRDVPPELCANLVRRIASGEFDTLSGCFLHVEYDLDALLRRADEIKRTQRLVLRIARPH